MPQPRTALAVKLPKDAFTNCFDFSWADRGIKVSPFQQAPKECGIWVIMPMSPLVVSNCTILHCALAYTTMNQRLSVPNASHYSMSLCAHILMALNQCCGCTEVKRAIKV